MNLALFDLDNTLLAGDSDYEWGQFLVDQGVVVREEYEAQNAAFYKQYKAGALDIGAFLAFALQPLAQHGDDLLARWHTRFMNERIRPMIGAAARALVDKHLVAGDLCAVVTATNSFVTAPIARSFGIENLVATEPERIDGRFTGRVAGTPCFREGKIERVLAWLARLGYRLEDFPVSSFYSDSRNDLPLLERVNRPVAVDPDEVLEATARARGWPVISLR
ncbi:MAG: HAD family hydrolase [Betaproteobacteria bacterium]|nr:HAD family hydrolase [Betaproteobacteria bacterium]